MSDPPESNINFRPDYWDPADALTLNSTGTLPSGTAVAEVGVLTCGLASSATSCSRHTRESYKS